MAIDQLAYSFLSVESWATGNILVLGKTPLPYDNIGVGLLKDSYLMGTFKRPPLDISTIVASVNMISSSTIPYDP